MANNARLKAYGEQHGVPLATGCSCLKGEHFGDELHPKEAEVRIITAVVFEVLAAVHKET